MLLAFVPVISGCSTHTGENTTTATYWETVNGVLWEVTYNIETREVVSAKTPLPILEFDISSPFYKFLAEYTSTPSGDTINGLFRALTLSAKPTGNAIFKIELTEKYTLTRRIDYEMIKNEFPSCLYTETPYSYEVTDHNTGETHTVSGIGSEIIFSSSVTTYEQKIVFTVPVT